MIGIRRLAFLLSDMNGDSEGGIFLSHPHTLNRLFFASVADLHLYCKSMLDQKDVRLLWVICIFWH